MRGKKLKRFSEIKTFPNVIEGEQETAGKWHSIFGNDHPITIELACGKGEYAIALSKRYKDRNFIGIDIKGNRIWVGAKRGLEDGIDNARFLRISIDQIASYFSESEVSEVWIVYPDPFLRLSKQKKRLTHPRFIRSYQRIISADAVFHLKTDSPALYYFTKKTLELTHAHIMEDFEDAYARVNEKSDIRISTFYESLDIAKSKKIFYLKWAQHKNPIPTEVDAVVKQDEILRKI